MLKLLSIFIGLMLTVSSAASDESTHKDEILQISEDLPGGDFTLHSSQGPFSLDQFRGKLVLLYFGYTKCPDVCPTSLATLSQALNELNEEELESVQAVFISVDPKRDSFEVLDEYATYFHPNLTGITGSKEEIDEVAKRYGAKYEIVNLQGSDFGYAVNHSAETYLITTEGKLRYVFPHETPSFVILEAIRYLLDNQQ
jgi:protein SCO1/2